MNTKSQEINEFLDKDLLSSVASAIEKSTYLGESTTFIEFMLEVILEVIDEI